GPGGWSSNEQNPVIVGVGTSMSGQYTVMAVVGGCTSVASSVTVQVRATPEAPVATSNGPLCAGQTLQLGASTIPGAVYTWSGPNGFSSGVQNPVRVNVGTLDGGVYTVYATLNGCRSGVSSVEVVVSGGIELRGVSSNSPVCVGGDLELVAPWVSGGRYHWSGPGGWSSTLQNPVRSGVGMSDGGVYSLVVSVGGCTSRVATVRVEVRECGSVCPVVRGVSAVGQSGGKAVVSWNLPVEGVGVCYVVSYGIAGSDPSTWSQVLVPHPNRMVVIEGLEGNRVYSFRVRTNCTSCSAGSGVRSEWSEVVSAVTPGSRGDLDGAEGFGLWVYPNPSRGVFRVEYESGERGFAVLRVYDMGGRRVHEETVEVEIGRQEIGEGIGILESGVYVVEVLQGNRRYQVRVQIVE
ncbi:MAG: fibronectin type III domain-containing protein, partial [Bacteroidia bacterium]|nr:fibronectin type III domain-containing protein [Bacteroidia bacterium]